MTGTYFKVFKGEWEPMVVSASLMVVPASLMVVPAGLDGFFLIHDELRDLSLCSWSCVGFILFPG